MRSQFVRGLLLSFLFVLLCPFLTSAQTNTVPSRITQAVDETNLTLLKGNTHPLARPEFDRGPAPLGLPMERMLLVLKRSADQEAALKTLLDEQQDISSPNYHQWLTPEQFGQQFGSSDQDIQAVTTWLGSHGFQVARVAKGRTVIEFSGTAGQVQEAFHTSIHKYTVNGEDHWANSSDPQIPTALAPVVAGVKTLHNFLKKPQLVITDEKFTAKYEPGLPPQFTSSNGTLHALTPADYAVIYNINPLYNATTKTDGTGTTIAVVGRSNIILQDVLDFRSVFGLPVNDPQIVLNGTDPGILSLGEEMEATLDTSWSGATVKLVVSASTSTADGVDLSEFYIIDNNLGNVMTESFSGCENQTGITSADATAVSLLAEQAAAQGITYMVSTGDSGAEGCDNPDTETVATGPLSVNILASSPYTVGVGGTLFTEGANAAKYWSTTNNSTTLGSALSYIPEDVWNESCLSVCGQNGGGSIWAGGGGASIFFQKPVWQSGVAGIPPIATDPMRDLPDVSLSAAGHDPYLVCMQYSCENNGSGYINFYGVSGTSASAPSFAGVMALVNQKTVSRQGQANYVLYRLAAQETLSSCNASIQSPLPASTCIFNDVTVGNNAVPGEAGYGTSSAKYQSGVGYDLATGLGSVNVANLVNGWGNARSTISVTTLTLPAGPFVHGTSVNIGVAVAPKTGSGTPTGDVSLVTSNNFTVPFDTLNSSGSASSTTNQLPGGTYNLTAHYEGDGIFLPSDSSPAPMTVTPETSATTLAVLSGSPTGSPVTTAPYGSTLYLQSKVTGGSGVGVPTGTVSFNDSIAGSLGSGTLDSTGSVTIPLAIGSPLGPGVHYITASYVGDSSFHANSSAPLAFTVTKAPSTTTLLVQYSPTLLAGQSGSIDVNVGGAGTFPTGTVTVYEGATQIGSPASLTDGEVAYTIPAGALAEGQHVLTASYSGDTNYLPSTSPATTVNVYYNTATTVTSSAPTIQVGQSVTFTALVTSNHTGLPAISGTVQFSSSLFGYLGSGAVTNGGQAQFTTTTVPAGNQTIQATYSGDTNYVSSTGSTQETVNLTGTTTTVTSSNPTTQQGSSVTFTATVAPVQTGGPAVTGTVQFTANGSNIGSSPVTNNQAQVTTSSLPVGSIQIQANYGGDNNYAASSGTFTETVNAVPTFTVSANPATITIASPGSSGSTTLTFTGVNGFAGTINLNSTMCSGMPNESSCSFGASSVTLSATTTTATSTFMVMTTAPSSAFPRTLKPPAGIGWKMLVTGIAVALLCLMSLRARRWRLGAAFATLLLAVVLTSNGCGGGSSGHIHNQGTSPGSYTVTISFASGSVATTAPVTVVVN